MTTVFSTCFVVSINMIYHTLIWFLIITTKNLCASIDRARTNSCSVPHSSHTCRCVSKECVLIDEHSLCLSCSKDGFVSGGCHRSIATVLEIQKLIILMIFLKSCLFPYQYFTVFKECMSFEICYSCQMWTAFDFYALSLHSGL
jgi:hypothetical protein